MVQAEEVEFSWLGSWRYPTDSGYQSLPATNLNFGIEYELRLQYIPKYQFQTNHYYDIKLEFAHSYGQFTFDRTVYQASNGYSVPVGTPTINSFNPDSYNTTVIIKGVNPDNAQRILNRIRFFFMVTPQDNGSTTSGSIHVGLTHMYIDDSTADNTIIEINDTVKDTNEKTGGILNKLSSLPNDLKNMLIGIFVPEQSEITSIFDDFNSLLEDRFGGLYQVFTYLGRFASIFVSGESSGSMYVPELSIDVPLISGQIGEMHHIELWGGGNVSLLPSNSQFNNTFLNAIKFGIDFLAIVFVFRFFMSIFSALFMSEESTALYMATLMNDYNEESEWESYHNAKGSWKGF